MAVVAFGNSAQDSSTNRMLDSAGAGVAFGNAAEDCSTNRLLGSPQKRVTTTKEGVRFKFDDDLNCGTASIHEVEMIAMNDLSKGGNSDDDNNIQNANVT